MPYISIYKDDRWLYRDKDEVIQEIIDDKFEIFFRPQIKFNEEQKKVLKKINNINLEKSIFGWFGVFPSSRIFWFNAASSQPPRSHLAASWVRPVSLIEQTTAPTVDDEDELGVFEAATGADAGAWLARVVAGAADGPSAFDPFSSRKALLSSICLFALVFRTEEDGIN